MGFEVREQGEEGLRVNRYCFGASIDRGTPV